MHGRATRITVGASRHRHDGMALHGRRRRVEGGDIAVPLRRRDDLRHRGSAGGNDGWVYDGVWRGHVEADTLRPDNLCRKPMAQTRVEAARATASLARHEDRADQATRASQGHRDVGLVARRSWGRHGQGVRDHDYAVALRVVTDVDAHRTERLSEETRILETTRSVDDAHARCDGRFRGVDDMT